MTDELEQLRERVAELEAERATQRRASTPGARARTVFAVVLIVLGVVLAPVAVLGTWAHAQLVDTDRFVQTFAPLAEAPEMQELVVDQVTAAIDESIDIDTLVGDLMDGLAELALPPRAAAAAQLLQGPAAEGVRSIVRGAVETVVTSPQFAAVWEVTLRETHARTVALLQGQEGGALALSADGALSLELGPVIGQVKEFLVAEGFAFAAQIPQIERSIPIVVSDSLALVRTVYQLATAVGYWLPWLVAGLLVAGVALAHARLRALMWAAIGYGVAMLLLASGLGVGRQFFLASVSPSLMPRASADVLFGQVTELMSATVTALAVLAVIVALGAWLAGGSRRAGAARRGGDAALSAVRRAADGVGLDPGRVGRVIDRWRSALVLLTVAVGILVIFQSRPVSLSMVLGTLAWVLLVLLLIELLRRPAPQAVVEP